MTAHTKHEAASFPAFARPAVPKSQGEHPHPDVTLTPHGRELLRAIARNRQPGDGRTRAHADVLVGCGLAAYRHGVYSVTETGEAYLAATAAEVSP